MAPSHHTVYEHRAAKRGFDREYYHRYIMDSECKARMSHDIVRVVSTSMCLVDSAAVADGIKWSWDSPASSPSALSPTPPPPRLSLLIISVARE
jgi:hypothetical protein